MCYQTISIETKNGRLNVPCGKCAECLQKRRSEWTFRLMQELKVAESASFVTLTYNDDNVPKDGNLDKKHVQLFIKRLRKRQNKLTDTKIRYYAVGEYGEQTKRPHYHLILYNCKNSLLTILDEIWQLGHIMIGEVNQSSIHYVTKYILINQKTELEKPFALMSTKPYLGSNYVDQDMKKYHKKVEKHRVTFEGGIKAGMPRVYKKSIFTKIERELNAKEVIDIGVKNYWEDQEKAKQRRINYEKRMAENRRHYSKQMKQQSKSNKV